MDAWRILASIALWLLAAAALFAQDMAPAPAGSAATAVPVAASGAAPQAAGSKVTLSGILNPSFSLSELVYSANGNTDCQTAVSGDFTYSQSSVHGSLNVKYDGGALLHSGDSTQNSIFQNISANQAFQVRRWTFTFGDTFSYLPQAPFANGSGIAGLQLSAGLPSNNLNSGLLPGNSILISDTARISNDGDGQVKYLLTRATSLTGSVSYGLLHYVAAPTLNTHQEVVTGGLNHETRRSQVGIQYQYSQYDYDAFDDTTKSQLLQLMYSRVLGKRFRMDGWVGPQFLQTSGIGGEINQVSSAGSIGVSYSGKRDQVQVRYQRSSNSGSGLLLGAVSDEIDLSASRTFRKWGLTALESYVTSSGVTKGQQTVTRSLGAQISREFNRTAGAYLSYTYRSQSATNLCFSGTCAFDGGQNTGGVGVYWHPRGWHPVKPF